MPFSEKIRKKVRLAAAFRCCRCGEIGIDAHHIVPEADDGSNTFENAAPLWHPARLIPTAGIRGQEWVIAAFVLSLLRLRRAVIGTANIRPYAPGI